MTAAPILLMRVRVRRALLAVVLSTLVAGACAAEEPTGLVVQESGPGFMADGGPMAEDEPFMTALVSRVCVEQDPVEIDSVEPLGLEGAGFAVTAFAVAVGDPDETLDSLDRAPLADLHGTEHEVVTTCSDRTRAATLYVEVSRPEDPAGSFEGLTVVTTEGQEVEVPYGVQACRTECP